MGEKVIQECEKLMNEYAHMPFDEALPSLQKGWHDIGLKYNLTGAQVFEKYMDWKSKQK